MKKTPLVSVIVSIGPNREIGKNNRLLWNIPEDLQNFKKITNGHPVIMGQNTYFSIGKPLPNRTNIVVTLDKDLKVPGCEVVYSIPEAIKLAKKYDDGEIFIIGGASIYAQTIELADKLYVTMVEGKFDADTFFPEYKHLFKKIISERKENCSGYKCTFLELIKSPALEITLQRDKGQTKI